MTLFGLVVLPMKLFGNLNNLGRVRRHDNRVMDMPNEPPPTSNLLPTLLFANIIT